jgi:hypothetical protein
MSHGEIAYFSLVICAMLTFAAVMGFVSWWSARPDSNSSGSTLSLSHEAQKKEMSDESGYDGKATGRADRGFSAAA